MKIRIYEGIDYMTEAMVVLSYISSEVNLNEIQNGLKRYEVSPGQLERPFRVASKIVANAKKKLKKDGDRVNFYFTPLGEKDMDLTNQTLAVYAILVDQMNYRCWEERAKHRKSCLGMSERERSQAFAERILAGHNLVDEAECKIRAQNCVCLMDVLLLLESSEYTAEQKWQVQWIFTHAEEAYLEVESLIEKAVEALEESKELWEPLCREFCDRWKERLNHMEFDEYISQQIQMVLEENEMGGVILPLITGMNQFILSVEPQCLETSEPCEDIYRMGIIIELINSGRPADGGNYKKKHVVSMLKILSDESKMEILTLLKERRYYGGELAKHMKLTTATISHHMSALASAGLVTLDKELNRIYYGLNEENIGLLLEYTRELLLDEKTAEGTRG